MELHAVCITKLYMHITVQRHPLSILCTAFMGNLGISQSNSYGWTIFNLFKILNTVFKYYRTVFPENPGLILISPLG